MGIDLHTWQAPVRRQIEDSTPSRPLATAGLVEYPAQERRAACTHSKRRSPTDPEEVGGEASRFALLRNEVRVNGAQFRNLSRLTLVTAIAPGLRR
jgi:hypothetical protein